MSSQIGIAERGKAILRDAAQRAVVPLTGSEIDDLMQRVLLALDARPDAAARIREITAGIVLRPSSSVASELAMRLRYLLGKGDIEPLFDLPTLLDEKLNIFLFPIEQNKLAGGCALLGESAFIFITDAAQDDALFTCAHLLGHLAAISARQSHDDGAALDPAGDDSTVKGPYEHFADAFASELLIPARGLGVALQKVRTLLNVPGGSVGDIELLYLSRIFGVNFLAIAKRCERAKLLPRGGAASLNQFLIDSFGGPERRAEELGVPPQPAIEIAPLPRSVELAISELFERGRAQVERAQAAPSRLRPSSTHARR